MENACNGKTEKKSTLEENLTHKIKFGWKMFTEEQQKESRIFAENYKKFLFEARTERERVSYAMEIAKEHNFIHVELGKEIKNLKPGDKIFYTNRNKNIALITIGKNVVTEKIHFVGAHLDTPRIDLKIRPLYEDGKAGLALLKTHYYGGMKKYQWATIPLMLTGVIAKTDGTIINIEIGKNPDDPVFMISDLLIHLYRTIQSKRTAADVIKAEEMNVLVGALPSDEKNVKEKFKLKILEILFEKYGIKEEDLQTAELSLVSGLPPRYVGFDKSLIGAAGQDDGVCAYTSLRSIIDMQDIPENTVIIGLFDKEETGSNGNTGAQSAWIQFVINDLLVRTGLPETNTNLNMALSNTNMLSADVTAAFNPTFPSVHDIKNASILGKGIALEKYSGSGGKYNTSDCSAEFLAFIKKILDNSNTPYQIGNLGEVDKGGGGTIAKFFAQSFNCDVLDAGTPVLNMHSPYEITHIVDVYATYLAFKAFISAK